MEAVTVGQAALTALAKALPSSKPEDKTFPRGSLHFGEDELLAIGRAHGGGWDINLIADAYREHMGARLEKLRGSKMIASWKGFCEGWVNRRGRP